MEEAFRWTRAGLRRRGGGGRGRSAFTGAKGNNLREELDELATVLTQDELKKFKELSQHKKKAPHSAS